MKFINKILVFSLVIILASCGVEDKKEYALSLEETLDVIVSKKDILSAKKLSEIILNNDTVNYQLIDIRTPHEFAIDHVDGAINIPAKYILEDEYHTVFKQGEKTNVLYCKGSHQALNTYLMLKQLDYENLAVSLGGFGFIKENILIPSDNGNEGYNDDRARYDYAKVISEASGIKKIDKSTDKSEPKKIVIKRKKKEVEGGCG